MTGAPDDHRREGRNDAELHGEARGDSRVGHELLGLVHVGLVVAHPLLLGQLPLLHGRGRRRGQPAEAGGGDPHDLAAVHRPADRLTYAHVLERAATRVDVEVVVAEPRAAVTGQPLLILQEVVVLVVLEEGVVDLPRPERGDDVGLVRDDPQGQRVHVGQTLAEVVGIPLERPAAARPSSPRA